MKTSGRQNNFNLLRLILALLVILGHSPELVDGSRDRELLTYVFGTLSFGELAVDGFFLLSGYLIMQSWDHQPQPWQFLKKRILRIYPGYVIAGLICALVVGPLAADPARYFADLQVPALLSSLALLQIPEVPAVFDGQPHPSINGAMWTISREFACYLFVLIAGLSGALQRRYFWAALTATVFAALLALKLAKLSVFDLRLASFFLSGGCYYLYRDKLRLQGVVAAAITALLVVCMYSWRGAELALASIGGYALLYVAAKRSALLSRFNRLPDVSYGVYLYAWPIQKLLLWYFPGMSPWSLSVFAAFGAVLAGVLSWYLIEKPALKFKGPSIHIPDSVMESGVAQAHQASQR
jgi:peptidoglycan/LPS O-acetylase OafA/YrhL